MDGNVQGDENFPFFFFSSEIISLKIYENGVKNLKLLHNYLVDLIKLEFLCTFKYFFLN